MTGGIQHEPTIQEWVESVLAEIRQDVACGIVPATVASFSELHDHVDANDYGQEIPEGEGENLHALWIEVQDQVDAAIKRGALRDLA